MNSLKSLSILIVFIFSVASISAQTELEKQLFSLPDITFKKIDTPEGFESAYEINVKQPIDHANPSKGHFYQRLYLSHKGFDRPTVMAIEGYNRPKNRIYELSRLMNSNQLDIEHRYFGTSSPEEIDYSYLNWEQMSMDLNKINVLFKAIYRDKWISTGISKGGTSTIVYKYFFPEDVDVAVPYVAPVNYEYEDKRIYDFLKTVGTEECRNAIKDFQTRALEQREEFITALKWFGKGAKMDFNYWSIEEAFEFAVLEYSFSFWQYAHDCSKIPGKDATIDDQIQHLIDIVGVGFYSDKEVNGLSSAYYQFATQMGYYGFETEDFNHLLKALPTDTHPHAAFAPNKMETKWDGKLTNEVAKWAANSGNQMIYIYGGLDTWSATGIPPSDKVDAHWFILEGKGHARARIRFMTDTEKLKFVNALEGWLEMDIDGKPNKP